MEQLTFKQYLESKTQLREAIKNTPISLVEYEVRKYCSVAVGKTEDEKKVIGLKPRQKIIVEWEYNDIDNPVPGYIKLVGLKDIGQDEQLPMFWQGKKLQKWLLRHTKQGHPHGF